MKSIFLLILLLIFASFIIKNKNQEHCLSKEEQLVNMILAKTARIIQDKYDLQPCGHGATMPGGPIQGLALCFHTKRPYTQYQLRELVINSAHELLNQVSDDKEIHSFIKEPPFNIKNVQVIIYNHDKNGRSLRDPEISNIQISQGVLNYATIDPEDSFRYKNEFDESYEDALKTIGKYQNLNQESIKLVPHEKETRPSL